MRGMKNGDCRRAWYKTQLYLPVLHFHLLASSHSFLNRKLNNNHELIFLFTNLSKQIIYFTILMVGVV